MSQQAPNRTVSPVRRRQLGRVLRELRQQAQMSCADVCTRLELSAARFSRLENGQTAPDIVVVKSLLDTYGIPVNDWDPYLELAREARKKGWWQEYSAPSTSYVALESAASTVRDFELAFIPGLLQTEEYMRGVLNNALIERSARQLDNQVAARLRRQRRLTDPDDPLELHTIVAESVLRKPIGHEQLGWLLMMAELPNVTLQVLSNSMPYSVGMCGAFTLLDFPDVPSIANIEHAGGVVRTDKSDVLLTCERSFARLHADALNPTESIDLIEQLADRR